MNIMIDVSILTPLPHLSVSCEPINLDPPPPKKNSGKGDCGVMGHCMLRVWFVLCLFNTVSYLLFDLVAFLVSILLTLGLVFFLWSSYSVFVQGVLFVLSGFGSLFVLVFDPRGVDLI